MSNNAKKITDPYGAMSYTQKIIMLSIEKFDDGALFDDSIVLPSFKGKWFCNKDMLLANSYKRYSSVWKYASYKLMNDKKFVLSISNLTDKDTQYIGRELRNDRDVALKFIAYDPPINFLGDELRDDSSFALELLNNEFHPDFINLFSPRILNDVDLFLQLIKIDPSIFKYAGVDVYSNAKITDLVLDSISNNEMPAEGYEEYWGCNIIRQNVSAILRMLLISKEISFDIAIINATIRESRELIAIAIWKCCDVSFELLGSAFINDPSIVLLTLESLMRESIIHHSYIDSKEVALTKFAVREYALTDIIVCLRLHGW